MFLNGNKNVLVYLFAQRSPEWYAIRENKWTGSTIIDLLKGAKNPPERSEMWDGNGWGARGRILEDRAIEAYELTTHGGVGIVSRYGFIENIRYPNAGYSPDGIDGSILLEAKDFGLKKHNELVKHKNNPRKHIIPMEIMAQVQFGLMITELKQARLVAYNPDAEQELVIIDIRRNEKIIKNIRSKLHEVREG